MNLIIVRDAKDFAEVRPALEKELGGRPSAALALNNADPIFPGPGEVGAFYYPLEPRQFDAVAISAAVRLFPGVWTAAFLTYVASLVKPGGPIVFQDLPAERPKAGLAGAQDIEAVLGPSKSNSSWFRKSQLRRFSAPASLPARPSTLSWYHAHAKSVLETHARASREAEAVLAAVAGLPERLGPGRADGRNLAQDVKTRLADIIQQHAYYVGGMSYKVPTLLAALNKLQPGRQGRSLVDVGAGYGLLMAELLMEPDAGAQTALAVDISPVNQALFQVLAQGDAIRGGRLAFQLASAQEARFTEPVDMVSYVGSLLYVPVPERPAVVGHAFEALKPGGVLIVHENIRAKSYVRDYEHMFEPEELDALLAPLGTIRYFLSTGVGEIAREKVARSTVFRAVAKPG